MKSKPWKLSNRYKRKTGRLGSPKKTFLIVCEGTKTEPLYFDAFKCKTADVVVDGAGANTVSVIKRAIKLKKEAKDIGRSYDQVWCVFDKDTFPIKHVRAAFRLAAKNDIQVAYSNESFELWYLLHYIYLTSHILRTDYITKLSEHMKMPYVKNSRNMYTQLLPKQVDAIRNAKKLINIHGDTQPEDKAPSTTVFVLVEELNKNL
jgi:hypothetical protein